MSRMRLVRREKVHNDEMIRSNILTVIRSKNFRSVSTWALLRSRKILLDTDTDAQTDEERSPIGHRSQEPRKFLGTRSLAQIPKKVQARPTRFGCFSYMSHTLPPVYFWSLLAVTRCEHDSLRGNLTERCAFLSCDVLSCAHRGPRGLMRL